MKRIVIVGATSGIGLEVARLCIRAGWRVGAARTPQGGPRSPPLRSPRPGRDRDHRHHPRRRSRTPCPARRTAGRHGDLFPRLGHRQPQHRAAPRHRTEHPAHQRRRVRQDGHGRFRPLPQPRRRTDRRHQLDRRHERSRIGPGLFGDQADAEHLHRRAGTAFPHGKLRHPLYGHPPRDSSPRRCSPATAATRC